METLKEELKEQQDARMRIEGALTYVEKQLSTLRSVNAPARPAMDFNQKTFDTAEITVPKAYKKFQDVFSDDKANAFPEQGPNDHAIDLIDD